MGWSWRDGDDVDLEDATGAVENEALQSSTKRRPRGVALVRLDVPLMDLAWFQIKWMVATIVAMAIILFAIVLAYVVLAIVGLVFAVVVSLGSMFVAWMLGLLTG